MCLGDGTFFFFWVWFTTYILRSVLLLVGMFLSIILFLLIATLILLELRVFWKELLYLREVVVRRAYTLSHDLTLWDFTVYVIILQYLNKKILEKLVYDPCNNNDFSNAFTNDDFSNVPCNVSSNNTTNGPFNEYPPMGALMPLNNYLNNSISFTQRPTLS